MVRRWAVSFLLATGRRANGRHLVLLDALIGYVALGRWLQRHGFTRVRRVATREDLFSVALPSLRDNQPLYVELGVHRGDSIRWWATHLDDPDARFDGFDSFVGLPETWNEENPAGHFTTGGAVPSLDDDRVRFFPGWFDDTLRAYEPPAHQVVFLNFDADLYESTRTALQQLRPLIQPGTWLYFDELNDKNHELRALDEFLDQTSVRISPVAHAANGRNWLFRVLDTC